MPRKTHKLQYTTEELDAILAKASDKPFFVWHDEVAGVYRFFPDEEKFNIWFPIYKDGDLNEYPEIKAYQFIDPITAPAPYTVSITGYTDDKYILEGSTGTTVDFFFVTNDRANEPVEESVDIHYNFSSASGTKTATQFCRAGTHVHFNIDRYLTQGQNSISITVRGRETGASKTIVLTYTVVVLSLTSTFNIANVIEQNTGFEIPYHIKGAYDKVIEVWIDGETKYTVNIPSLSNDTNGTVSVMGLPGGKHTMQMFASMNIKGTSFKSKLLYYEFIVKTSPLNTIVIAEEYSDWSNIISGVPNIKCEQYVAKIIKWAYYTSNNSMYHNTITWNIVKNEQTSFITSKIVDSIEIGSLKQPETLKFIPSESGNCSLQAIIANTITPEEPYIIEYGLPIDENSAGISETTNGMTMKLSAAGRSNSEPTSIKEAWTYGDYSTTFNNVLWNNNSGWNGTSLVLSNGGTAVINNKPFGIAPQNNQGCVFEIEFESFNVKDGDAEIVRIGSTNEGAYLAITTNKALLRSYNGKVVESRFKSDEKVKIAFVVYPINSPEYSHKIFLYNNAVLSSVNNYDENDVFDIGYISDTSSSEGFIHLGNADGNAGIKVYSIRTYNRTINMYEELNNYIVDSGENIGYLVEDNDIYQEGSRLIDVNKLETTITTVKITGPLNILINAGGSKQEIECKLEVSSPFNDINYLKCDKARAKSAGQSTLNKPVPSMHIKLGQVGNECTDIDGNIYPKQRYAFRKGNTPEKKFRLQANYMDSSGCHNAAFFRLFNEIYRNVELDGKKVLRIPAEKAATDVYPVRMAELHGNDRRGSDWSFPYNINMLPDSVPCIVLWKPTDDADYNFLGQYVLMEEKKANYANGMHSIYSGVDSDGKPDPYGFKKEKEGEKIWDNNDCCQMEFLRSGDDLALFNSYATWNDLNESDEPIREETFELIYPDEDDITNSEYNQIWTNFFNEVIKPITDTFDNHDPNDPTSIVQANVTAFEKLLYGENLNGEHYVLDPYHFAAYYCLVMRNCCTDSFVRNMELVTYEKDPVTHKSIWLPKWWDVDMQCGLEQSGACDVMPSSDRYTPSYTAPAIAYCFSGKLRANSVCIKSSWLLDALESSTRFMNDVKRMDDALYKAGWKYENMVRIQDEEYINKWCKALYNESSVAKYINYADYLSLQGDRTPHRHWFLKTSYNYFDALRLCGDYKSRAISMRCSITNLTKRIKITSATDYYFGWGYTNTVVQSALHLVRNEDGYLNITRTAVFTDPLQIYAADKILKIDCSEIAPYIVSSIKFGKIYNSELGVQLEELILGVSKTEMHNGVFNTSEQVTGIGRDADPSLINEGEDNNSYDIFAALTKFDIQGMRYFISLDMHDMGNLTHFYAAGSGLTSFTPAQGSQFTEIELPTSINNISMVGCNITDANDDCVIKWYDTIIEDNIPTDIELHNGVPGTIKTISAIDMGNDKGTKQLILDWVDAIEDFTDPIIQLTCNSVNWTDVPVSSLVNLSKIRADRRNISGYIKVASAITSEQMQQIIEGFGSDVFTTNENARLRIDSPDSFVIAIPNTILAGESTTITSYIFPLGSATGITTYQLGTYVQGNFVEETNTATDPTNNELYYFKDNVRLYTESGLLITNESADATHDIAIRGVNGNRAAVVTSTIQSRTYPQSLACDISFSAGTDYNYDSTHDIYYVSSQTVITLSANTGSTPFDGTITNTSWNYSSISSIVSNVTPEGAAGRTIQLQIISPTSTAISGDITLSESYANGVTRTVTKHFIFKEATSVVTQLVNPYLQALLKDNDYAANVDYTRESEVLPITDLSFIISSTTQSNPDYNIKHFAEINSFVNITNTTLDLSNCSGLGTNHSELTLEDNVTRDFVDYLPRKYGKLIFDFTTINLSGTQLKGVGIKDNSSLTTITYSNYTEEVKLVGQTNVSSVTIPTASASTLELIHIENCNNLSGITWN